MNDNSSILAILSKIVFFHIHQHHCSKCIKNLTTDLYLHYYVPVLCLPSLYLDWFNNLNVSLLLFLFLIIYFQNRSIIPMSVKIKTSPLQQPTNCYRSFSVSSVLWSHFFLPFLLFTLVQQHCLCCSANILDPLLPQEFG